MSPIAAEVRGLVRRLTPSATLEERQVLERLDAVFDEPMRIAIAGMVKSGKSTLLNALVGQRLAPTDTGECTRIVTWYGHGPRYEVTAVGFDGDREALRFERGDELVVDLEGRSSTNIERLDVRWPSERLVGQQLIDTPGLGSLSRDVSSRTAAFLTGDTTLPVDAVVYLLRHRHPADLAFLEAFHGGVATTGAMGAIGVLSRADELAGGHLDALAVAERVAATLSSDARIQRLCQSVVPVAGLLAETSATLRNDELVSLRSLGELDEVQRANALLTVDRFLALPDLPIAPAERGPLVERLGLFGLRLGSQLVAEGSVSSSAELASALTAASGIGRLRQEITTRFSGRAAALRARSALGIVSTLQVTANDPEAATEIERITAGAHELAELDIIDALRSGTSVPVDVDHLVRLFGGDGATPEARLGIALGAAPDTIRSAATAELERWRRESEHPLATPDATYVARMAVRTCEGLVLAGR